MTKPVLLNFKADAELLFLIDSWSKSLGVDRSSFIRYCIGMEIKRLLELSKLERLEKKETEVKVMA